LGAGVIEFPRPNSAAYETELLFAECRDNLIRYLRHHLDDDSEAEDIAQESFIRYFQARNQKEGIQQPRAWLFRVAHNLLIDWRRKRKPELLDERGWFGLEGRSIVPVQSVEASIQVSQLSWQRLTEVELECLRLRSDGLRFREIGAVLGLSISTVASYLSRAVRKLQTAEVEKREAPEPGRAPATVRR
jgi:RNA polymerase sigma-70 factor (ECF subfamily)